MNFIGHIQCSNWGVWLFLVGILFVLKGPKFMQKNSNLWIKVYFHIQNKKIIRFIAKKIKVLLHIQYCVQIVTMTVSNRIESFWTIKQYDSYFGIKNGNNYRLWKIISFFFFRCIYKILLLLLSTSILFLFRLVNRCFTSLN